MGGRVREKKQKKVDKSEKGKGEEKKKRKRKTSIDKSDLTMDEKMAVDLYKAIKKTKNNEDLDSDDDDLDEDLLKSADGDVEDNQEDILDPATGYNEEDEEKRAITYKIAKNKGLMPKRSKLQRNPRVKNRMKFEKAKKRRKGAVREVRDQKSKYGGEGSGVNVRVKKGVKIQ